MRFSATLELHGKTATGIAVPDDVISALAGGGRPPVQVRLNGHRYRTTVARMGGQWLIPVSAQVRTAAQLSAGDTVDVDIELDTSPREVTVPPDLAVALDAEPAARTFFDGLSFTHRKEWVRWIEEAKRDETRQTRLGKTVEALRAGRRTK